MQAETKTLKHNIITYAQLKPYIDSHKNCCVVNPCGSGKSSIITQVISEYKDKNILFVTKQKNAAAYYYNINPIFNEMKIPIITYNKFYNMYEDDTIHNLKDIDICIIDEAHYMGAYNWSNAFTLLKKISGCIFIGVTATPQRYQDQGTNKTIVDMYFDGNSVGNFTTQQLQKQGVFIEPEYIVALASLEQEINNRIEMICNSNLSDAAKTRYTKILNDTIDIWQKDCSPEVVIKRTLSKYMYRESGNKILVFCENTKAFESDEKYIMSILKKTFPNKSIKSYCYSYKSSENIFNDFLTDTDNYINVLFAVNKVCETIHIPDLNIMMFLRCSVSNRIITQQIGRVNDVNNKHKSLIIDMVNNLSRYDTVKCKFANIDSTHSKQVQPKEEKINLNFNFDFTRKITRIFSEIDKVSNHNPNFIYKNVKGTIQQLCYIFRKDKNIVMDLISKGYNVADAMDTAPNVTLKTEIIPRVNDKRDKITFEMTDEDRKIVETYQHIVTQIAHSKNCYDDDIIGDTYLYFCHWAHEWNQGDRRNYASLYLSTNTLNYILKRLRCKYDYESKFTDCSELNNKTINTIEDNTAINDYYEMVNTVRHMVNTTGTEQNVKVIKLRYGFDSPTNKPKTLDEVSICIGRTRERVRQIEAKTIRTYRQPSRSRKLREYMYLFAYHKEIC